MSSPLSESLSLFLSLSLSFTPSQHKESEQEPSDEVLLFCVHFSRVPKHGKNKNGGFKMQKWHKASAAVRGLTVGLGGEEISR